MPLRPTPTEVTARRTVPRASVTAVPALPVFRRARAPSRGHALQCGRGRERDDRARTVIAASRTPSTVQRYTSHINTVRAPFVYYRARQVCTCNTVFFFSTTVRETEVALRSPPRAINALAGCRVTRFRSRIRNTARELADKKIITIVVNQLKLEGVDILI